MQQKIYQLQGGKDQIRCLDKKSLEYHQRIDEMMHIIPDSIFDLLELYKFIYLFIYFNFHKIYQAAYILPPKNNHFCHYGWQMALASNFFHNMTNQSDPKRPYLLPTQNVTTISE